MSKNKKQTKDWYNKLTEAEKAIWKLIYYHPTFITNRTSALDLLFCTIGTGLKWKDGEIVDEIDDNYLNTKRRIHSFNRDIYKKAYTNTFWGKEGMCDSLQRKDVERMRAYCYYENCIAEWTGENIEKLVKTSIVPKSFYPLGKYAKLIEIPKDIKDDWLELAIETCDLILATDPLYKCCNNRLQNKDNIRLAKKQKTKLLKMKQKGKEK